MEHPPGPPMVNGDSMKPPGFPGGLMQPPRPPQIQRPLMKPTGPPNMMPPMGPPRMNGGMINGPPRGPPTVPPLRPGGLVNGKPIQSMGPPQRPPQMLPRMAMPPTPPTSLSKPQISALPSEVPSSRTPELATDVTNSTSGLLNGHTRPNPPDSLPAPSGSMSNLNTTTNQLVTSAPSSQTQNLINGPTNTQQESLNEESFATSASGHSSFLDSSQNSSDNNRSQLSNISQNSQSESLTNHTKNNLENRQTVTSQGSFLPRPPADGQASNGHLISQAIPSQFTSAIPFSSVGNSSNPSTYMGIPQNQPTYTNAPTAGPAIPPTTGPGIPPATGPSIPPATGRTLPPSTSPAIPPTTAPAIPPLTGQVIPPSGANIPPRPTIPPSGMQFRPTSTGMPLRPPTSMGINPTTHSNIGMPLRPSTSGFTPAVPPINMNQMAPSGYAVPPASGTTLPPTSAVPPTSTGSSFNQPGFQPPVGYNSSNRTPSMPPAGYPPSSMPSMSYQSGPPKVAVGPPPVSGGVSVRQAGPSRYPQQTPGNVQGINQFQPQQQQFQPPQQQFQQQPPPPMRQTMPPPPQQFQPPPPPQQFQPQPPPPQQFQPQPPPPQQFQPPPQPTGQQRPGPPTNMPPQPPSVNQLSGQLGGLSVTRDGWNRGWGTQQMDLLQQRVVVPPQGEVPPKVVLAQEYLPSCKRELFCSTLTKVPETKSVLQKSRLPFGILIHPFKDLEHLPVVSCNTIVRCRACRTYINPFVVFKGDRRWECNLCFRVNELPEEFQYDPVSRTYGDPSRRPEVREATIEFIAPQEYMLRPPQPATYLWVLDVSRQAVDTGYLKIVCDTLLATLDKIPGDRRTMIGFITYSESVQFYLMGEDQKGVQMLDVGEIDDIFIPSPESLLVNIEQSRSQIEDLLSSLPEAHGSTFHTQSALGAALQAAYKLMSPIGGRITVMSAALPTVGPGSLSAREDPNQRAAKDIPNLGPATDFYKKLALDCSGQQIAVDLFTLNTQYLDLATLTGMSKFSGGCIHHFSGFHAQRNPASVESFTNCLTRYITRKIGFEAVMRIRATRGLAITNFHGNFFVRSTDLLSLPNINPDAGFGMQVNIEEPLHNIRTACFQAALLYTSSRGERRIRVHTLCLPVTPNIHEVVTSGDQQAIISLLSKMAVDRSQTSSMSDAREAMVNACVDALAAFKMGLSSPAHGALESPSALRLMPLYSLALFKCVAFRSGLSTKLDDRVFAMCELKSLPLKQLITTIYPDLYPIHELSERGAITVDDQVIPQPGCLHLSAERLDRNGAYLMDTGGKIFIYVRSRVSPEWVSSTLGVPSYEAIPQPLFKDALPPLETPQSQLLRLFVAYIQRSKPYHVPVIVLREDNPARMDFIQHLVDDRTEGAQSYIEFLQYIKTQVK
ncbi:unnamed protein product [Meganyctiphanes norvegica]|uniref:Protein transport protein Sec24A n=1 Tax=Meganyctiphanes norvegica TaxID=48144 RepID=A0AAV2QA28_MEGNR